MDLVVERSDGDTFTVELRLYDYVIDIKEKIQQSQGIPVSDQTLVLGGATLSDDLHVLLTDLVAQSRVKLITTADDAFVSSLLRDDIDFDSDNIPIDNSAQSQIASAANQLPSSVNLHNSAQSQIASAANQSPSSVNLHNSGVFAQSQIASVANHLPSSSSGGGVNFHNSGVLHQPAIAAAEIQKVRLRFLTPTTDRIGDMEMNAADTIRKLKQRIHAKLGISIKSLLLRFIGKDLLDENKSLKDYQISDNSFITVWDRTGM